jgi:hypothetical protein
VRCVAILFTAALAASARPALASPAARLVYARSADAASCPDESALRGAVAARFGYDPFFAWARRTVVVEVSRRGDHYASRVQMLDERGVAQGERELSSDGSSCSEIFDATALAISIALDASSKAEKVVEAPPTPPPVSPSTSDALSIALVAPRDEPLPRPMPQARSSSWFVGADLLGSQGTAPSISAGATAFVEARENALSAALEVRFDAPASATVDRLQASSWLYAAQLAPCFHLGPLSMCAIGSIGQFVIHGVGVPSPSSATALFAAAGARVGVEWPLSSGVLLRAHADGFADLSPPTYRLDATYVAWTAPTIAGGLAVGVAVRIP